MHANGHSNRIYYTSTVYNKDGNVEFNSVSTNNYLPNDGWTSSGYYGNPTTWAL